MKIGLTKYGWPQVVVFPAITFTAMVVSLIVGVKLWPLWAVVSIEISLTIVLVWILAFFRDPSRVVPTDCDLLLSPADGRITDIEIVEEDEFIGTKTLRIGIFLNIFNVHINRAPCSVKIEKIIYKKGKYKNAASPLSARVNESNDLWLIRKDSPKDKLIVRQISGAIARRIVCKTKPDQELVGGEKFGMIKFGSRTELYVPSSENIKCLVKIGDKVKAGLTTLVKYEK